MVTTETWGKEDQKSSSGIKKYLRATIQATWVREVPLEVLVYATSDATENVNKMVMVGDARDGRGLGEGGFL